MTRRYERDKLEVAKIWLLRRTIETKWIEHNGVNDSVLDEVMREEHWLML